MLAFTENIHELQSMKKYPKELSFSGNKALLQKRKISIVGTRKPSKYTRQITLQIASTLAKRDVCIVSGGAMGVDAVAHQGAGSVNTIAVLPCGIDIKYPSVNKNLLQDIEQNGLLLSQFETGFKSRPWSFVARNELVVALGEVLVVAEADLDSGSMRSVEFALEMGKEIFVVPQRLGESLGTNMLLDKGMAKAIYDIEAFANLFGEKNDTVELEINDFAKFCATNPFYEDAIRIYPSQIFEAELQGIVKVHNSKVYLQN